VSSEKPRELKSAWRGSKLRQAIVACPTVAQCQAAAGTRRRRGASTDALPLGAATCGAARRSALAVHLADRQEAARRVAKPPVNLKRVQRSPDAMRKLSRQMAAYMRYGVLAPPAARTRRCAWSGAWPSGWPSPTRDLPVPDPRLLSQLKSKEVPEHQTTTVFRTVKKFNVILDVPLWPSPTRPIGHTSTTTSTSSASPPAPLTTSLRASQTPVKQVAFESPVPSAQCPVLFAFCSDPRLPPARSLFPWPPTAP
jgi:hypothetical protein